jgi:FdrA protein
LGFVNRVLPGSVGIIAASGTGAQAVSSALSRRGKGISHIIGIGSRDLTARIGGASFRTALAWLAEDVATSEVVIVAKPPDAAVLQELIPLLRVFPKPVAAMFLGPVVPPTIPGVTTVANIGDLISAVTRRQLEDPPELPPLPAGHFVRGLFQGGTLAIEASYLLDIPLASGGVSPWTDARDVLIDFGDDRYTVGRPHPMLDGTYRGAALQEALQDPQTGIVLGDLVLGDGAETNPAAHVVSAVKAARALRGSLPSTIFTVVGTPEDPQNYENQVDALRKAGIWVTEISTTAAKAVQRAMEG